MSNSYWQRVLPPWPVVPARLWLTGAGCGLAMLSLIFRQELWPSHPQMELRSWVAMLLLVQAGGVQAMAVLCRWSRAYVGPGWMRLTVRVVAWAVGIGIAILLLILLLLICLVVPGPPQD